MMLHLLLIMKNLPRSSNDWWSHLLEHSLIVEYSLSPFRAPLGHSFGDGNSMGDLKMSPKGDFR